MGKIYTGIFLFFFAISALYNFGTEDYVTFTVESKERIVTGSGDSTSSKWVIFTDIEVFKNVDTIFRFKFNSADIQGELKEGKTYNAKVYGWRIGFFSMYRNIIEVREVKGND